jgi:hypothetical protein
MHGLQWDYSLIPATTRDVLILASDIILEACDDVAFEQYILSFT